MPRQPGKRAASSHAASQNAPSEPFLIVTTSSAKLDAATRKQVRSHVMRGKNRKQRPLRDGQAIGSWINGREKLDLSGQNDQSMNMVPPRVGNDMSHISFADEMQPHMLQLAFKFFTVLDKAMKEAKYPVEACVQPIGTDRWLDYLAYDKAYLHSVMCATQGFMDYVSGSGFSETAIYHLNKTMSTLRQNLAKEQALTSDSTICTVLTLAMLADVHGDPITTKKHLDGLFHLVKLRGGIASLRHNNELQQKVVRADLSLAMSTGSKPMFFADGFSWDAYLVPSPAPGPNPADNDTEPSILNSNTNRADNDNNRAVRSSPGATAAAIQNLCPGVDDPRLLNTVFDLQEFSRAANLAYQTGRKIPPNLFREVIVSVQYRLLALRHEGDLRQQQNQPGQQSQGELYPVQPSDLLLVGMLAFTTTTFLILKQMPIRYADLARRARLLIHTLTLEPDPAADTPQLQRLKLWFVFVARVSVLGFPVDEDVLMREAGRRVTALGLELGVGENDRGDAGKEKGWEEVRAVLRVVMWVDWMHSKGGRVFWEKVRAAAGSELRGVGGDREEAMGSELLPLGASMVC